jgi:hypothetical protein
MDLESEVAPLAAVGWGQALGSSTCVRIHDAQVVRERADERQGQGVQVEGNSETDRLGAQVLGLFH